MREIIGFAVALLAFAGPVRAGVNLNGAMVVHTNDTYSYSAATRCSTPYVQNLSSCQDVNTRTDLTTSVVWLLAAFQPGSSPRVAGLCCKISYSQGIEILLSWLCGPDPLEVPDADWPASGTHDSIAFSPPIVGDIIFPFYGFHVDSYGQADEFCTAVDYRTVFADDHLPPVEDPCYLNGCVRWYRSGYAMCQNPPMGACCYPDGSCQYRTESECYSTGGLSWNEGISCMPNPCPQPMGACCIGTSCIFVPATVCFDMGGQNWFMGQPCDPNPCLNMAVGDGEADSRLAVFGPASPNPSRGTLECEIRLRSPADVHVELYDLNGRVLRRLLDQGLATGTHAFKWQTRDPGGREIPSGMYALRFEASIVSREGSEGEDGGRRTVTSVQRILFLK